MCVCVFVLVVLVQLRGDSESFRVEGSGFQGFAARPVVAVAGRVRDLGL